jgi:hypothetical protein
MEVAKEVCGYFSLITLIIYLTERQMFSNFSYIIIQNVFTGDKAVLIMALLVKNNSFTT